MKRVKREIVSLRYIYFVYKLNRIRIVSMQNNKIEKRQVIKDKVDKQDTKRVRQKWMTDFFILTEFNKLVIGTG